MFASFAFLAFIPVVLAQCPILPNPLPQPNQLPVTATLPSPFKYFNGTNIRTPADWTTCRRPELLKLAQEYFYGYYPNHTAEAVTATRSGNSLRVDITANGKRSSVSATLALPSGATKDKPVPLVISAGYVDQNTFTQAGVGVATFDPNSVAADSKSKTGAFWTLYQGDIGVLTAWAWGFHRILDGLIATVPEVDSTRVGVTGCSRYGKAALAAGVFDERVALTLPMSSGLEGTGPFRYFFEQSGANEKIDNIYGAYPYWTTSKLGQFIGNVPRLPVDANILTSLVAPRALIWDTGSSDYWVNPQGAASVTFPATQAVYKWLGAQNRLGVALRSGGHCEASGYTNVRDFMRKIFFNATITRTYTDIAPWSPHTVAFPWINDV